MCCCQTHIHTHPNKLYLFVKYAAQFVVVNSFPWPAQWTSSKDVQFFGACSVQNSQAPTTHSYIRDTSTPVYTHTHTRTRKRTLLALRCHSTKRKIFDSPKREIFHTHYVWIVHFFPIICKTRRKYKNRNQLRRVDETGAGGQALALDDETRREVKNTERRLLCFAQRQRRSKGNGKEAAKRSAVNWQLIYGVAK